MARKKKITINDLAKLSPKQIIILIIAAVAFYFLGGGYFTRENAGIIQGVVMRVVDGDTAVIRINGQERRVRFLGVDTPETVHPNKPVQFYGKEASNFTKRELTGKRVWLEYDASPTDRYNRLLAYIWTSEPSEISEKTVRQNMFNAKLLLGGYAKVMIIKPNRRYSDLFNKFQSEAKQARKGLWSE